MKQPLMKNILIISFILLLAINSWLQADVLITELKDRIEVKIDGEVFTEWRHKEWASPYLYPVIGPNGENITRHFPMKLGAKGEEPDHPWHRSIRFSHSDVNGFNFWWAPGKEKAGHTAEVKLEKIEALTSGKTGEMIFWNQWLGDGKLVLREKVRLYFIPLDNRQLLMDFDIELHAPNKAVLLGDKRDGGLLVRVAGTMKVEDEKGTKFDGTIINSRGDKNRDTWGKRAEWVDYFGPDTTGKTVGIAMFDHPGNLRFPTHWHARTYGLLTANRFGTDHFKGNYNDHKTLSCSPSGNNCPACASHSGDHLIPAGTSINLRHRFYFHHGDSKIAKVVERYNEYTVDKQLGLKRMKALAQDRKWKDLTEQFSMENFNNWSDETPTIKSEAYYLRAQAYYFTKNGKDAEIDCKAGLALDPKNELLLLTLADNYANNLNDEEQALVAYRKIISHTGKTNGWLPISSTLAIARILTDQVKIDEALAVLDQYADNMTMAPVWRIKVLRAYGHAYAAQGKEKKSLEKFREALQLETKK